MSDREIVINACFGGFGLSACATEAFLARKGKECYWFVSARDENGRLDFSGSKVPTDDPDADFLAFSYTSPDADDDSYFYSRGIERDDPDLVAVVRELGKEADGRAAALAIVTIPADVDWFIDEYDGNEHVAEQHRTWYAHD